MMSITAMTAHHAVVHRTHSSSRWNLAHSNASVSFHPPQWAKLVLDDWSQVHTDYVIGFKHHSVWIESQYNVVIEVRVQEEVVVMANRRFLAAYFPMITYTQVFFTVHQQATNALLIWAPFVFLPSGLCKWGSSHRKTLKAYYRGRCFSRQASGSCF